MSRRLSFRDLDRSLVHAGNLVAWFYLYIIAMLAGWLLLTMTASGWRPIVLTSGSMSPSLDRGDVLLIEPHPEGELLGQRAVITYRSNGGTAEALTTHRIFEVDALAEHYVTKGDANPNPDTTPVPVDEVEGVGRLVVPFLGLPVVWARDGNLPALIAVAVLSAGAAAAVANGVGRRRRNRTEAGMSRLAERALNRARIVMALMVAGQWILDRSSFETELGWLQPSHVVAVSIVGLLGVNRFAHWVGKIEDPRRRERLGAIELAADTALVLLLATVAGQSGVGWVLIAFPLIEAAIRFRISGALTQWVLMVVIILIARLWALVGSDVSIGETIASLEESVDQLGILLLAVIPGAYLAEQLLSDVNSQQQATAAARERGRLLGQVAEVGHEVNRLGAALFETLVDATIRLGFDIGDVWIRMPDGHWRRLAGRGDTARLPEPGQDASGLRDIDLDLNEALVDRHDHESSELAARHAAGFDALVRFTLSKDNDAHIVLRAATAAAAIDDGGVVLPTAHELGLNDAVDALRLLCGQATVALHNESLMGELTGLYHELEHRATHDALTGLPNRSLFVKELQTAVERDQAVGHDQPPHLRHHVLFMDLNGFKQVNDTLGHDVGDELLRQVAARLRTAVGDVGLVARLGGDEFTVLVSPTGEQVDLRQMISAIHAGLRVPFDLDGKLVQVGTSVGMASTEPGLSDSEVLRRADVAMYTAKNGGGSSRTCVYSSELDEGERRRGRLAAEFRKALAREHFALHYQPVVRASTGLLVGAEALLRWEHRELGWVSTDQILDLAEDCGAVDELNAWIMRTALTDAASCEVPGGTPFFLAVNVSPRELASPALRSNIGDALLLSGLPPEHLVVELSERIIADGRGIQEGIRGLLDLGLNLSLDDFGEGKTALAHLRGLPISQLKLDRLLVQQAIGSEPDRIILESVIRLAHDLSFQVVAEGIEDEDHRQLAVDAGADFLQGYGLYRPMQIDQLRRVLHHSGLAAQAPAVAAPPAHVEGAS